MSRGLLIVSAVVGLALAAPQGALDDTTSTTPVPILKQINKVNDDGSYTFGYEAADGTFKVETRDANGNISGRYGYFDENGELKTVDYVASNGGGFIAKGNHLPVPAVPVAAVPASGIAGPDTPAIPLARIEQAKVDIKKNNAAEDFSTDENENGIPDALEGVLPELRSSGPTVAAPVAPVVPQVSIPVSAPARAQPAPVLRSPVPTPAAPVQVFQQAAPLQHVPTFHQATLGTAEADPSNTFIQQTPQGFQFAFTAPVQPVVAQQPQQARALPLQFQQNQFGQFQQFPQQFLQFAPQH